MREKSLTPAPATMCASGLPLYSIYRTQGEYLNEKGKGIFRKSEYFCNTFRPGDGRKNSSSPFRKISARLKKTNVPLSTETRLVGCSPEMVMKKLWKGLTMEDIDTYTMITRRIQKEDVFSIVDSYFMP